MIFTILALAYSCAPLRAPGHAIKVQSFGKSEQCMHTLHNMGKVLSSSSSYYMYRYSTVPRSWYQRIPFRRIMCAVILLVLLVISHTLTLYYTSQLCQQPPYLIMTLITIQKCGQ